VFSLVNSTDPDYTDACMAANITCTYCCCVTQTQCTNDRSVCEPVTDRNEWQLYSALIVFAATVIAFPLLIRLIISCSTVKVLKINNEESLSVCEILWNYVFCCCCKCLNKNKATEKEKKRSRFWDCFKKKDGKYSKV